MKKIFKSFSDKELEETLSWINQKLKAGNGIEDALQFCHCYGAIDELLTLRPQAEGRFRQGADDATELIEDIMGI